MSRAIRQDDDRHFWLDAPEGTPLHQSTSQPGLYFWAQEVGGSIECFNVVSQVAGYPATEAHDDWFANMADADGIARKLAEGTL